MSIDLDTKVFYKQYDIDYRVNGNGETEPKADKFKLNIYFDPMKRASDITNLSAEIEMPRRQDGRLLILFVGAQIDIANAFGFEVPEGCRPTYTSKKSNKGKRGRPPKPQTENS